MILPLQDTLEYILEPLNRHYLCRKRFEEATIYHSDFNKGPYKRVCDLAVMIGTVEQYIRVEAIRNLDARRYDLKEPDSFLMARNYIEELTKGEPSKSRAKIHYEDHKKGIAASAKVAGELLNRIMKPLQGINQYWIIRKRYSDQMYNISYSRVCSGGTYVGVGHIEVFEKEIVLSVYERDAEGKNIGTPEYIYLCTTNNEKKTEKAVQAISQQIAKEVSNVQKDRETSRAWGGDQYPGGLSWDVQQKPPKY